MSRKSKRPAASDGGSRVVFAPGTILDPIPGSIRWVAGKAVGWWGDISNPIAPQIQNPDGSVRPASPVERRAIERLWPRGRR